jgi:hypothetical protein
VKCVGSELLTTEKNLFPPALMHTYFYTVVVRSVSLAVSSGVKKQS